MPKPRWTPGPRSTPHPRWVRTPRWTPTPRSTPAPRWVLGLLVLLVPALLPPAAGAAPARHRILAFEQQILDQSNSARLLAGCPELRINASLSQAATEHSVGMAERDFFEHTDPEGLDPIERAREAGYPSDYVGENIAAGNRAASMTFQQWMNSAGHRRNILNCAYTDLGVGHAYSENSYYKHYWSQELGNPVLMPR